MKMLEYRIGDKRILRLIRKWLKTGYIEDGKRIKQEIGTPQGAVISPLIANVFLHYVLDVWVAQWRKSEARGDMIIVRYADDFVIGFQHHTDALKFQSELKKRVETFGLKLHPEKTRLIEFGRYASSNRKKSGKGKPETFDFLCFTVSRTYAQRTRREDSSFDGKR
jgi:RNA-directed DNA polymerase